MKLCEIRGVSCHLHPVLALFLLTGFLAGQGELLLTAFFSLLLHETAHTLSLIHISGSRSQAQAKKQGLCLLDCGGREAGKRTA